MLKSAKVLWVPRSHSFQHTMAHKSWFGLNCKAALKNLLNCVWRVISSVPEKNTGGKNRSPFGQTPHSDQSMVQGGRSSLLPKLCLCLPFCNAIFSRGEGAIIPSCKISNSPYINYERAGESSCLTELSREESYLPLKYRKQWSEVSNLMLRPNVTYGKGFTLTQHEPSSRNQLWMDIHVGNFGRDGTESGQRLIQPITYLQPSPTCSFRSVLV